MWSPEYEMKIYLLLIDTKTMPECILESCFSEPSQNNIKKKLTEGFQVCQPRVVDRANHTHSRYIFQDKIFQLCKCDLCRGQTIGKKQIVNNIKRIKV